MMKKKPTIEELQQKEVERIQAYKDTFKTESGQLVLKDLKAQFYDNDLLDRQQTHNTHYNLGLRDGVRHIIENLSNGETE